MDDLAALLLLADAYQAFDPKIAETTVSWRVFSDSKKLKALRSGKSIQHHRLQASLQWFSDHWPIGLAWPDGVQRKARLAPDVAA